VVQSRRCRSVRKLVHIPQRFVRVGLRRNTSSRHLAGRLISPLEYIYRRKHLTLTPKMGTRLTTPVSIRTNPTPASEMVEREGREFESRRGSTNRQNVRQASSLNPSLRVHSRGTLAERQTSKHRLGFLLASVWVCTPILPLEARARRK
jgi:hypothetical protein